MIAPKELQTVQGEIKSDIEQQDQGRMSLQILDETAEEGRII